MNILQFVPSASCSGSYGGPTTVCETLARSLTDMGHRAVVVTTDGGSRQNLDLSWATFTLVRFKGRRLLWRQSPALVFSTSLLAWLFRHAKDFDVIHVHSGREPLGLGVLLVSRIKKVPVVLQTHGMLEYFDGTVKRIVDRTLGRLLMSYASFILALTPDEQRSIGRIAPRAGCRIMRNPVAECTGVEKAKSELSPADVLFLARLHPRKRVALYLEAARILIARETNATFSIVGPDEGDLELVLHACADPRTKGRLRYEGAMTPQQARRRIASSSVFVAPADREPFGMTIAEAMAEGVPVVATTGAALHSAWQRAGAAHIVPGLAIEIAEGIELLVTDPSYRKRLIRGGREWTGENCSPRKIARDIEDVYKKVT